MVLQCGRIYKDAEIVYEPSASVYEPSGFNVAASIKMRKSIVLKKGDLSAEMLQCGRIYKDAEIKYPPKYPQRGRSASMWPHL